MVYRRHLHHHRDDAPPSDFLPWRDNRRELLQILLHLFRHRLVLRSCFVQWNKVSRGRNSLTGSVSVMISVPEHMSGVAGALLQVFLQVSHYNLPLMTGRRSSSLQYPSRAIDCLPR
jgi:hypothetical protein